MSNKYEKIFKITNSEENKNKDNLLIKIDNIDKSKKFDFTMRVVASLMKRYNDEFIKPLIGYDTYEYKKELITQFENVMKAIRYEVTDMKDLFKSNKDNIELLLELSNSIDLNEQFYKLLEMYSKKVDKVIVIVAPVVKEFDDQKSIYEIEEEIAKSFND